jgi:hypothetical protein
MTISSEIPFGLLITDVMSKKKKKKVVMTNFVLQQNDDIH